jgi:hypothetical protein
MDEKQAQSVQQSVQPEQAGSTPAGPEAPVSEQAGAAKHVWPVPPEAAGILRDVDLACSAVLQKLGSLEVEYLTSRSQLLDELRSRRTQFKTLLDDTARKGGIDIDRTRWQLDSRTMTLIRSS